MRKHSVDFVVSQINRLKEEYSCDSIVFWDDEFFADRERAFAIVEQIYLRYGAYCRIDYVDDKFAKRLAETGCRSLLIGLESGSERIPKLITKDITVSDITSGVHALAKYPSVQVNGSMIFGYPTETYQELSSTLKLIVELLELNSDIDFTVGWYIPYPGSELYDFLLQHGFRPPKRTEDWEDMDRWVDKFEITWVEWLSSNDVKKIRKNIHFLSSLYRYNVPLLKGMVIRQFVKKDGQLGVVLSGLRSLHEKLTKDQDSFLGWLGAFVLKAIWKRRIRRKR